jgi:hypothetical protein
LVKDEERGFHVERDRERDRERGKERYGRRDVLSCCLFVVPLTIPSPSLPLALIITTDGFI